ncbi:MAG: hypothetical protein JOZ62_10245, partial [Acidobacteriaceae bacterium]|nr:hypothetical protein [Acidobacteriaceae bacterium]
MNDFLPAANFGSKTPTTSLPVVLQAGGAATLNAQITGDIASPRIIGHVAVNNFAVEQRSFDNLSLDLAASPSAASIQNGLVARSALQMKFDASVRLHKWSPVPRSPVTADVSLRNATVTDLLAMAGESSIPATGQVSADVHVNGTYGNPLGSATVQVVNGTAYEVPFNRVYAQVNLRDQLVTLSPLQVVSDAGTVDVNATFQHPPNSFTTGNAQLHVRTTSLQLATLKALQERSPGLAGAVQLTADAAANVREVNHQTTVDVSNISADLSARGLVMQKEKAGDLTLTARTASRGVDYRLISDFAGSNINVNGHTALTPDYATTATASIQNLSVEKVLRIAGQSTIPASGTLSADARVSGTIKAPKADLTFGLRNANVYQEPIDSLAGTVHYSNTLVDIPTMELRTPAGALTLAGSFTHPANNFNDGSVKLKLNSSDIRLARIHHVHTAQPTFTGTLRLASDLSATLRQRNGSRDVLISYANADVSANALRMNSRDLGQATFTARTSGSNMDFRLDSNIASSQIHASGRSSLTGDYPVNASLTFTNIRYSNIAPFVSSEPAVAPAFDALVEGAASVHGPLLNTNALDARVELSRLQAQTSPTGSPTGAPPRRLVTIQNHGPVVVALNHSVVDIQQFRLEGPDTFLNASGTVNLKNETAPMNLKLDANVDLGILQDVDRDFYSSGNIAMNAAVHGTFAQPLVNGRIELKDANVNYAQAPNGLSHGNGVILLNGTGATIQSLTGESGGGKITVTGFAGLTGQALTYNVKAAANKVRVRYSGISVTSNAAITLIGNSNRSLVTGNVTVGRIAYNSSSDAGSILSNFASTPPSSPSAPS